MSAFLRKLLYCRECNGKTSHVLEDGIKTCEECNTTTEN